MIPGEWSGVRPRPQNAALSIRHSASDGYFNRKVSAIGLTPTARHFTSEMTA